MFDEMNCNTCGKSQRPEAPTKFKCKCNDDVCMSSIAAGAEYYVDSRRKERQQEKYSKVSSPSYEYEGNTVAKNGNYTVEPFTVISVNLEDGVSIKNSRNVDSVDFGAQYQWNLKVEGREQDLTELSHYGAFVGSNGVAVLSKDCTGKDGGDKFPVITEDLDGEPCEIRKGDTVSVVLNVFVRKDGSTVTELDKVTLLRRAGR